MRIGLRQWIAERAELLVLAFAVLATASLVAWWTILLRGELVSGERREREVLQLRADVGEAERIAGFEDIAARHARRNIMLVGESSLMALLLSGSLVVLYLLAQRRRRQREDMEKLLQFTSHEFKTPVAGVKGLLQSLALGSIPGEQRAELIRLGQLECDRLEHLAETILAYQRAMARDSRDAVPPIDAVQFIDDLLAHRARTAAGEVQLGQLQPAQVLADRDGLRVILENLLDNANKYGAGTVQLTAGLVDGRWRLDIRDRGRGFTPETAEKIFDLHDRGSGEGMTHGAGLGLSIARQLARRMGGDISAFSAGPGQGAVFSVTLQLAPANALPAAQQGAVHG